MASPQMAYATFQAMLMMQLVDPSVLQHVVASTGQAQPQQQQQQQAPMAVPPQPTYQNPGYQGPATVVATAPAYVDPQQQQRVISEFENNSPFFVFHFYCPLSYCSVFLRPLPLAPCPYATFPVVFPSPVFASPIRPITPEE